MSTDSHWMQMLPTTAAERVVGPIGIGRRLPWLTASIVLLATALRFTPEALHALWYDPSAPSLLSLFGCHLAHFSTQHFAWDALTFALVGAVGERANRTRHATFLLLAAAAVPPLACALEPWVSRYAGLSGLVIGQVALALASLCGAALRDRSVKRALLAAGLLGLLFVKQFYECHIGNTSVIALDYKGFATVPAAHLVSAVIGTLVGAVPHVVHWSSRGPDMRPDPAWR